MTLYPFLKQVRHSLIPYKHINTSIFSQINYETLYELQKYSCLKFNSNILFQEKYNNDWNFISYKDFSKNINNYSKFLSNLNIQYGDIVGCISNNRSEVATLMYACYSIGAIYIGMYNNQSLNDINFIMKDASIKNLFISNDKLFKNLDKNKVINKVENLYIFDTNDKNLSISNNMLKQINKNKHISFIPNKNDVANIIYTSGTTSPILKGVELTHNNFISNIKGVHSLLNNNLIKDKDKSLSYVPWSHSYGLTELNGMMSYGASIAICNDIKNLKQDFQEVKPNILFSVPLLLNTIKNNIDDKINTSNNIIKYLINITINYKGNKNSVHYKFLDHLILSKIKQSFGGNIKYIFSAGASTDLSTIKFYNNIGIKIYQGYGLTETSPIVSLCNDNNYLTGSVGKILNNLDVKILDTNTKDILGTNNIGEVCVTGPSVFQKYYNKNDKDIFIDLIIKNSELNLQKAYTIKRKYLKTGDLGYIDENDNLFITGRIKDTFKLDNGKFIVPSIIENKLNNSKFIKNILIYGYNKPYIIALIEVNLENTKNIDNEKLYEFISKEILVNSDKHLLKKYEIPQKFLIIKDPFTVDNGCLTSKLSIKKHFIFNKYSKEIDLIYKEK